MTKKTIYFFLVPFIWVLIIIGLSLSKSINSSAAGCSFSLTKTSAIQGQTIPIIINGSPDDYILNISSTSPAYLSNKNFTVTSTPFTYDYALPSDMVPGTYSIGLKEAISGAMVIYVDCTPSSGSSITVTSFDCAKADVNNDTHIGMTDISLVTSAQSSSYNPLYDMDGNGKIDNTDVLLVGSCIYRGTGDSTGLGSGRNPCPGGTCLTALGPIPTNLKAFSEQILKIATGIAGGIAFILMVVGAIRILTSQGDPKNMAGGREMLVAALAGLLFLIFSVLILRFIGINLLGDIPGIS